MHLAQVGAIAQPPRLRQLLGVARAGFSRGDLHLVQEPGQLSPAAKRLLQLNLVRTGCSEQHDQLLCQCLVADRLKTQKHRYDGLLHLPVAQTGRLGLNRARLGKLALKDRSPLLVLPGFGVYAGKGSKLTRGFGQIVLSRLIQQYVRPDQRARVPLLRIAQGNGERPQDAPCSLEPVELGPARVEDLSEIRVKGVTAQIPLLRSPPLFPSTL